MKSFGLMCTAVSGLFMSHIFYSFYYHQSFLSNFVSHKQASYTKEAQFLLLHSFGLCQKRATKEFKRMPSMQRSVKKNLPLFPALMGFPLVSNIGLSLLTHLITRLPASHYPHLRAIKSEKCQHEKECLQSKTIREELIIPFFHLISVKIQ